MKAWEILMRNAKHAYQTQSYRQAISLNKEALKVAKRRFNQHFECDPDKALASVLVSHFSLSDAHIALADLFEAYQEFEQSYDFLVDLYQSVSMTEKQKIAFQHALQQLKSEWSLFLKNHSSDLPKQKQSIFENFQASLHNEHPIHFHESTLSEKFESPNPLH